MSEESLTVKKEIVSSKLLCHKNIKELNVIKAEVLHSFIHTSAIKEANVIHSNIKRSCIGRAKIEKMAIGPNTKLNDCQFGNVLVKDKHSIINTVFTGCLFNGLVLTGGTYMRTEFNDCLFINVRFDRCFFSKLKFHNCGLSNTIFDTCNFGTTDEKTEFSLCVFAPVGLDTRLSRYRSLPFINSKPKSEVKAEPCYRYNCGGSFILNLSSTTSFISTNTKVWETRNTQTSMPFLFPDGTKTTHTAHTKLSEPNCSTKQKTVAQRTKHMQRFVSGGLLCL